ncbi:hypothetical protein LOTGIDRAFT_233189 [Lottia gigantea]|uniref:Large ribosomal subunit protein uL15m n=1 Tax=Lottia gigantea TaxID=225164 RepID=V4ABJ0_LOTGI|nr:hypothetical protein LOTGIDRAFT_233189 [Lottia gigantea]ESO92445.1 hypothetical protein LOTGIDRAFT_233189 [Lottia gigantea]
MSSNGIRDRALNLVKILPRLTLGNLKRLSEDVKKPKNRRRDRKSGKTHGKGHKGQGQRMTLPRLGFEGGNTPFYLQIPKEPYYRNHELRKEYVPLSLLQLQRMIDLHRVDINHPIDLSSLCNTKLLLVDWERKQFGVHLTDEGAEHFDAKINLEVQKADEVSIAAIEKCGGIISTRYYDPTSLHAVCNPAKFFARGTPIPVCKVPPKDDLDYYCKAENRGYLAKPEQVLEHRLILAQRYGYMLKDFESEEEKEMLLMRKDPEQIFYGLRAGWVVNLKDRCILKPKETIHEQYYKLLEESA